MWYHIPNIPAARGRLAGDGKGAEEMERGAWKTRLAAGGRSLLRGARLLALSAVLGGLCGGLGALFHHLIDWVTHLREGAPWLLWLLPLGGVATLLCYRLCRVSFEAGTNLIITSVTTNARVPALLAPLIVVGTTLSHLLGASVGREGAALQLGGSVGHSVGRLLRLKEGEVRLCAMCGMAACFSAMFGAPLTACVFVLEVVRVGSMRYYALLPCLTASCVADLVALTLGAAPLRFDLTGAPEVTVAALLRTAALAALCAAVGAVLCAGLEGGARLAKKRLENPWLRIALGGGAMTLVTVGFGLYDYAGAGSQVIAQAVAGQAQPWAFAVKLALTVLCVSAGFRGGEIVPTLFIGATFGCAVGPLLGLDPGFAACVGMIALFCAAVNCPMASLFLAAEVFATHDLVLFAAAVAVTFALSGRFSLYDSQVYDRAETFGATGE